MAALRSQLYIDAPQVLRDTRGAVARAVEVVVSEVLLAPGANPLHLHVHCSPITPRRGDLIPEGLQVWASVEIEETTDEPA